MTTSRSELIEVPDTTEERRAWPVKRIKAKNEFEIHLFVYLVINAMSVLVWAFTSAGSHSHRASSGRSS